MESKGFDFSRQFFIRAKTGLLSGLCAGALMGLIEGAWVFTINWGTVKPYILPYGAVLYGIIGLFAGLGAGIALGVIAVILKRTTLPANSYAFIGSAYFWGLFFILSRFRIFRDVMKEHALPLWLQMGLFAGSLVLFLLSFVLLRLILRKGIFQHLTKISGSAALFIILAALSFFVGSILNPVEQEYADTQLGLSPEMKDKPNIFYVVVDTLRADYVTAYGYRKAFTPNLDKFAEDAVLFEKNIVQSSWTRPSVASLLTSLYPSSHQAFRKPDVLSDEVHSIAEVLTDAGWVTSGIANNINISPGFNFHQGFTDYIYLSPDYYFFADSGGSTLAFYQILRRIKERFLGSKKYVNHYYQDADVVNETFFDWIDKRGIDRKFFAFIHYMDPHDPYFVHPYNGVGYARVSMPDPDPDMADEMIKAYRQEVEFFDEKFGDFIDRLKRMNLYEDAVIILTADHGEEFYEHGGWWHGTTLYEEQIHVPLIVKLPSNRAAGTSVKRMIRSIDIPSMILGEVGIEQPDSWQGIPFPVPPPEEELAEKVPMVFSEEDFEGNVLASLRTETWKLIKANPGNPRGLPTEELFNLEEDPLEKKNLRDQEIVWLKKLGYHMGEALQEAAASRVERSTADLDEDTIQRLKKLGYVEE